MDYEKKLNTLGLSLPQAPKPVASYVPVIRAGNLLFLSGMLPFVKGQLITSGKIGESLTLEQGVESARIALLNGLAVIKGETGSLDEIAKIVRIAVYVASSPTFTQQPLVANGASELLANIFGDLGQHARLALGTVALPLDSPVELEMIVEVRS